MDVSKYVNGSMTKTKLKSNAKKYWKGQWRWKRVNQFSKYNYGFVRPPSLFYFDLFLSFIFCRFSFAFVAPSLFDPALVFLLVP